MLSKNEFAVIIREYKNAKGCQSADDEIRWFQEQPTLKKAIEFAALARDGRGKRYSHQRRPNSAVLKQAKSLLLPLAADFQRCESFDAVHGLVEHQLKDVDGLAELYHYDTAFRIGIKLGLFPKRIYLHRGTRRGARALQLNTAVKTLEIGDLPQGLRKLRPHEAEDVLCRIAKAHKRKIRRKNKAETKEK